MSNIQKAIFAFRWIRYGAAVALRMEYKQILFEAETRKDMFIPFFEEHIEKYRKQARKERKDISKYYHAFLLANDQEGIDEVTKQIRKINAYYDDRIAALMVEINDLRSAFIMASWLYMDHCERIRELNELHQIHFLYCSRDKNTLPTTVDYGLRLTSLIF